MIAVPYLHLLGYVAVALMLERLSKPMRRPSRFMISICAIFCRAYMGWLKPWRLRPGGSELFDDIYPEWVGLIFLFPPRRE